MRPRAGTRISVREGQTFSAERLIYLAQSTVASWIIGLRLFALWTAS